MDRPAPSPSDRWSPAHVLPEEPSECNSSCHQRNPSGMEAMQTNWTNEKHSMYLNHIEEMFVNHLYSCKYQLPDSYHRFPKIQNNLCTAALDPSDFFHDQFTSRRMENNERCGNFRNGNNQFCSSHISLSGCHLHQTTGHEASSSSSQLPSSITDACHQELVCSLTEMSDQNFVDKYNGDKKVRRTSRNRRNATSTTF